MAKMMLQTRHLLSKMTDADWSDEQVFNVDKHGNASQTARKFMQSINRDRYEIRWIAVKTG